MVVRKQRTNGFSLVELVIVIVILGIIAAIAIPRISSGSRNAGESALRANLATLRNAIDWYYSEHNSTFPGAVADGAGGAALSAQCLINQLTLYSDGAGQVSATKDDAHPYGPYLRNGFPKLPVGANAGSADITVTEDAGPLVATPADTKGWKFSVKTGQIMANLSENGADGVAYSSY